MLTVVASSEGVAAVTAGGTLLAAAGVAFVTLRTTKLRLTSAREHQQRELAHSRDLADVADLRQVLDEAGRRLEEALGVAIDAQAAGTKDAAKARGELAPIVMTVVHALSRIRIRLGKDDPITQACEAAVGALGGMVGGLEQLERESDLTPSPNPVIPKWFEFFDAVQSFYDAAVARVGT
jgi:hypothetical protein